MTNGAPVGSVATAYPGWMRQEKFELYMKHFIRYSRASTANKCIVILDNHESHISPNVETMESHQLRYLHIPAIGCSSLIKAFLGLLKHFTIKLQMIIWSILLVIQLKYKIFLPQLESLFLKHSLLPIYRKNFREQEFIHSIARPLLMMIFLEHMLQTDLFYKKLQLLPRTKILLNYLTLQPILKSYLRLQITTLKWQQIIQNKAKLQR